MNQIKNLIFDLGNVIINIDPPRSVATFQEKLPEPAPHLGAEMLKHAVFLKFETGEISEHDFREVIRQRYAPGMDDETLDYCWNALLLDIPRERIELLKALQEQYRIFLLSNTNSIHVREVEKTLDITVPGCTMESLFEKVYYSHEMNTRKPDPTIYTQVLEENGLAPGETVFIDDNEANIKSAATLGIHALHLDVEKETVLDLFERDETGKYQVKLP